MTANDFLSREEKDALSKETGDTKEATKKISPDDYLSALEQDALGEIGNITFGSAATALSTLLKQKVDITTPKVTVIPKEELYEMFPNPHVAVHVDYVDGFQGINLLVIRKRDAQIIADLMMGGEGNPLEEQFSEIHISAVQEAMNQMMGSSATSMSSLFNRFVNISPPSIDIFNLSSGEGEQLLKEDVFIAIMFRIKIGDLVDSRIMQLLPVWFAREMVSILMNPGEAPAPPPPAPSSGHGSSGHGASGHGSSGHGASGHGVSGHGSSGHASAAASHGTHAAPPPMDMHTTKPAPPRPVQTAQFSDLSRVQQTVAGNPNLNLLLDIPLQVTVELGRTRRQIRDILEMSQGFIIELDKLAGEPVDVLVNNKLIAKGEVVVIDENFGVRVTDIISPMERIQKLQ